MIKRFIQLRLKDKIYAYLIFHVNSSNEKKEIVVSVGSFFGRDGKSLLFMLYGYLSFNCINNRMGQ